MKERPILFSGAMVRALLAGTKTQTRRIVKPQPQMVTNNRTLPWEGDPAALMRLMEIQGKHCPYGQPGDRLWVRETCRADELPDGLDGVRYLADRDWRAIENTRQAADDWVKLNHYCGKRGATVPAIHMPRWASRITLEITGVRVQRLTDISEGDARAEGARECDPVSGREVLLAGQSQRGSFVLHYRDIWEQINGPGSWDANPWVWAVDFKRLEAAA